MPLPGTELSEAELSEAGVLRRGAAEPLPGVELPGAAEPRRGTGLLPAATGNSPRSSRNFEVSSGEY